MQQRADWYGVGSIPDVRVDGSRSYMGGGSCNETTEAYRELIDARLAETGGVSPVEIRGEVGYAQDAILAIRSTFELLDPAALTDLHAIFLVVEDSVSLYGEEWPRVVREIHDRPVTLSVPGDSVAVDIEVPIDPTWDWEDLYVIALLQQASGSKPIIHGLKMAPAGQNFAEVPRTVGSVPEGNGTEIFDGLIRNETQEAVGFVLEEAASFGDWPLDAQVGDDPSWRTLPFEVALGPGESVPIRLRVLTDDAVEIRSGTVRVTSRHLGLGREIPLKVFNRSWSILFVDDDDNRYDQVRIVQAMDEGRLLYDTWDASSDDAPSASVLDPYDAVVWHTGISVQTQLISVEALSALRTYIDGGGRLLLSSQSYLNHGEIDPEFTSTYLGVSSSLLDQGYADLRGVEGDPIGDGLDLFIDLGYPLNKSDVAYPANTAVAFLHALDMRPAALRNEAPGDRRTVFLPWALHGLDEVVGEDNITVIIRRSLDWLHPVDPAFAVEDAAPSTPVRIDFAQPNPFRQSVAIRFTVDAAASSGPARLEVFDLEGSRIALLLDGILGPGEHTRVWDGRTQAEEPAGSGVYFARLTTWSGTSSIKLIRMD